MYVQQPVHSRSHAWSPRAAGGHCWAAPRMRLCTLLLTRQRQAGQHGQDGCAAGDHLQAGRAGQRQPA